LSVKPAPSIESVPQSGIERGMILMAAGALMAPGIHAIAKSLGGTMSAGQVSWARFFFQLAFLLPFVWIGHGGRIPWPSASHGIRGLLLAAATLLFFWALNYMPLATGSAIFFVEPLLLTAISAVFLGEPIGWRRITAIAAGFAGALIVIRPSFAAVGYAALLPLLAALCFAVYLAITRQRAARETALVTQFWVCLFSMLALSLAIGVGTHASANVLRASWPAAWELLLLGGMGLIALISHRLAINAFRLAPASILAPFQYLEIFGSIALGALIFGDLPDALTSLGTAIIVGSGLYVFHRERLPAGGNAQE
jgi:drug/metabolite transporter (DMT)-like permease